jgi:hypothetical protein
MAVGFKTVPTDDPVIRQFQENVAALAQAIPTSTKPVIVTVTSDYQIKGTEDVIHVNAQAGPVKVTLRSPSSTSRPVTIKQVNLQGAKTAVHPVTVVSANGQKTIAGASSLALDDTGTGSVSLTSDDLQHWPTSGAGGNPPVPVPSPGPSPGLVYIAGDNIKIVGNVISWVPPPPSPVPPFLVPWIAPVPFGNNNTFISPSDGSEGWACDCMVDFTGAPSAVTAYFWFEADDTASAGIARIRIGNAGGGAVTDPTYVTASVTSTTETGYSVAIPLAPPAGLNRVTLTLQSTNTNQTTLTGVNLQFR